MNGVDPDGVYSYLGAKWKRALASLTGGLTKGNLARLEPATRETILKGTNWLTSRITAVFFMEKTTNVAQDINGSTTIKGIHNGSDFRIFYKRIIV